MARNLKELALVEDPLRFFATRALLLLGGLAAFAAPSSASTFSFTHCNVPSLCGLMKVATALNGNAVDVTVFADAGLGIFGDSGANRAFAFNLAGPSDGVTVTNLTEGFSDAGAGLNVGGPFGAFEFVLNGPHTGRGAALPLRFTLIRLGGFSSSEVFDGNDLGYFFTAHVKTLWHEDGGLAGWAAGGEPIAEPIAQSSSVIINPEPASLILLGTGAALFGVRQIRRKRSARSRT